VKYLGVDYNDKKPVDREFIKIFIKYNLYIDKSSLYIYVPLSDVSEIYWAIQQCPALVSILGWCWVYSVWRHCRL
jgi:hypothetical protein